MRPPPEKVLPVPDKTMLDVPALNVRFVLVAKLIAVAVELNVTVLLPRLIVRVLLLLDDRDVAVTLKLLVVKVPRVTVIEPEDISASCKVTESDPVDLFTVIAPRVFPALVKVTAPALEKLMPPENVQVIPATAVRLPNKFNVPDPANVPVNPVKLQEAQNSVPVLVTVTAPDAASKNTLSADVGTDAPPAPPDVAAHLVPAVPSQLAVPPTQ